MIGLDDPCDLVEWPDGVDYSLLDEVPCEVTWCGARRRKRQPPIDKYDRTVRFSYGKCRDRDGDYSGLIHRIRLNACLKRAT